MTIGFRVHRRKSKANATIIKRFLGIPVANVSDSMSRMTATGARLRPYHAEGVKMAGPALTVKTRPGDNLLVHKAIDMAEEGDIIVVDAGGDLTNAIIGEIMAYLAQANKIGGFVIDGAIRDVDEVKACGLPVFAAGATHRGPYKDGPGEVNVPIAIDGMVIHPGDVVIGDSDGAVCIPLAEAETVLTAAEAKQAAEAKDIAAIHDGTLDRSWVDEQLRARGCDFAE